MTPSVNCLLVLPAQPCMSCHCAQKSFSHRVQENERRKRCKQSKRRKGRKQSKPFDVALGLNGGDYYGQLDAFAKIVRKYAEREVMIDSAFSKIVGSRITNVGEFKEALPTVLSKCEKIHFNMHNFTVKSYLRSVQKKKVSRKTKGDVTNYELYTVLKKYRSKVIFYRWSSSKKRYVTYKPSFD